MHLAHHHCHSHHHDEHHQTPKQRLADAKAYCAKRGARFTPLREEVFRLILQADKPMGAYDLISALQQSRLSDANAKKPILHHRPCIAHWNFCLKKG